jgi:hypothetical protein
MTKMITVEELRILNQAIDGYGTLEDCPYIVMVSSDRSNISWKKKPKAKATKTKPEATVDSSKDEHYTVEDVL